MRVAIHAEGEEGSGKTFILKKIATLLEVYGFEIDEDVPSDVNEEVVIAAREDDQLHYIDGANVVIVGDWMLELNESWQLVDAHYKGDNVMAREVIMEFAAGQLTTVSTKNIVT